MKKNLKFLGYLGKLALVTLLPIGYVMFIWAMFKEQIWFAPSASIILGVGVFITLFSLVYHMNKPKIRLGLVPAFGFFLGYDRIEPSCQILIGFLHIEISSK